MAKRASTCLIRSNSDIKEALMDRWNRINYLSSDVVKDAVSQGQSIDKASLSRTFKRDEKGNFTEHISGGLSQENFLWLCERYGVDIKVTVKKLPLAKVKKALKRR